MRSDDILGTLIESNVLEPSADGESLSLSSEFHTLIEDTRASLDDHDSIRDGLEDRFDDPDVIESLAVVGEDDLDFVASYCALAETVESLSHDDVVRTVAVLTQIRDSVPRSEGAPDLFLPVHGDQLPTLLQFTPRAIVYVWREECEPCDLMRETFEDVLEESPEDIALFSIYGPDYAEWLYEEYDVSGAPATLFMIDGRVDSRLYGAHYPEAIEGEMEKIRERSASP